MRTAVMVLLLVAGCEGTNGSVGPNGHETDAGTTCLPSTEPVCEPGVFYGKPCLRDGTPGYADTMRDCIGRLCWTGCIVTTEGPTEATSTWKRMSSCVATGPNPDGAASFPGLVCVDSCDGCR